MNRSDMTWRKRALILLLATLLFRIFYNIFLYAFDLSGDEAYYWDWGRRPDWGYYSKPPLIGWLMALLRILHVDSAAGLRCTSTVIGTGMLGLLFLAAEKLYSTRSAFWVLALSIATIGNAALNICMTTDVLLSICWVGALLSLWRLIENPTAGRGALFMLCMGIGLLAKQMMLAFFPITILFLLVSPEARGLLKRPVLWISWLCSLLFGIPPLIWNARHEWITLQHTEDHFHAEPGSILSSLSQVGDFIATQFGLMTPVSFGLLLVILIQVSRSWRHRSLQTRYLFVFSGLPLLGFFLFSFHRTVNPNWPLVFYLPALILMGGFCCRREGGFERWMKRGVYVGGVLVLLFYIGMVTLPAKGRDLTRIAPLREVSGWKTFAEEVAALQAKLPEKDLNVIVAGHRYYTAALAFYHPDRPRVLNWNASPKVDHQYDLWPWPEPLKGDALLVVKGTGKVPEELAARFASLELLGKVEVPPGARKPKRASVYFAKGRTGND